MSVTEKCKRLISGALSLILALGMCSGVSVQGHGPVAGTFSGSNAEKTVRFSAHFEKTDAAQVKFDHVAAQGVCAVEPRVDSFVGEFTDYSSDNPVSVNKELTYGSAGETEKALIDGRIATKLCAVNQPGLPLEITFRFSEGIQPQAYYLTGAGDDMQYPERVLSAWKLYGTNDEAGEWSLLDSHEGVTWQQNNETKMYSFSNSQSYTTFKLVIEKCGNTPTTNPNVIQFSGFGLGKEVKTTGSGEEVNYLYTSLSEGPSYNWAARSGAWSGVSCLHMEGTTTAKAAKNYVVLYDGLDIPVGKKTRLSYLVFPDIGTDYNLSANDPNYAYDFEYTSMYSAIDLEFDDGTCLSDYEAIDQYGNVVSPAAQGEARVMATNNWLQISTKLSTDSNLLGKRITKVLAGFEKNDATPGKDISVYFDDVEIFEQADPQVKNLADYVNILRGTYSTGNAPARGLNVPIVATPFGFNYWVPTTDGSSDNTPYAYSGAEARFKGIKISHVASNWIGESGTYYFSADSTTRDYSTVGNAIRNRGSVFSHENEIAKPYYYGVTLNADDAAAPNVKVEVTPTEHAAVLRFTFPAGSATCNIMFDPVNERSRSIIEFNADKTEFYTTSEKKANGQTTMHIVGQFSQTPVAWHSAGEGSMGMFQFAPNENKETVIEMKVATSFISKAQAQHALSMEIAGDEGFDKVQAKALKIWNDTLRSIEVEGGSYHERVTFYSNLYRAFVYPTSLAENTGTNDQPHWQHYSPYTGKVVDGQFVYNNGFWDTFRTAWPLYSIVAPEKATQLLDGLIQHYREQGWIPRWIAPAGTDCMVGTNSDNIFADALNRGVTFDVEAAYASALRNGSVYSVNNGKNSYSGRAHMDGMVFRGYVPQDGVTGGWGGSEFNFSWSMEGSGTDFAIASMAKYLRDKAELGSEAWQKYNDEYLYFTARATNYVHLFNESMGGWFRAKKSDGTWLQTDEQFDPTAQGYGYCEDNAYNYAFPPYDGQGLANLYGMARDKDGRTALGDKLDEAYSAVGTANPGSWTGHKENWEGRDAKQGQIHMTNQPAHHIPYMYLYTDRPWRTAEFVRDTLDRLFVGEEVGQGYLGDDDNGELSAWYVLSSMGLYPLTNGNGVTAIGTPLFEKVTIHRDDGHTITISAPGVSRENKYVQSLSVNGVSQTAAYLSAEVLQGERVTLDFAMGSTPSDTWGMSEDNMPPSITEGTGRPQLLVDHTKTEVSTVEEGGGNKDTIATNAKNTEKLFNNKAHDANGYASWDGKENGYLTYHFASPIQISMYTLTSWDAEHSPKAWKFYGSMNGENWTELDARSNQSFAWDINPTDGGDKYTRPFAISEEVQDVYSYYKIEFENAGQEIYLAELELLGGEFAGATKEVLLAAIQEVEGLTQANYAPESWNALQTVLESAKIVHEKEAATHEEIGAAISALNNAVSSLVRLKPAAEKIEAVSAEIASAGVKYESTKNATGEVEGTVSNLGGLTPGSYVGYRCVDFDIPKGSFSTIILTYAEKNNDADVENSKVTVHLDNLNSEPIAEFVRIEGTGDEWNTFRELTADLKQKGITGVHDVYLKFHGATKPVMNLHSLIFGVDDTQAVIAADLKHLSGDKTMVGIGDKLEYTLTAEEGFELPDTIVIVMDGKTLGEGEYTYSKETGTIVIEQVTGNICISAEASSSHVHSWSSEWSKDETHHWHECTAEGCTVTDNADKDGYAEHVWDKGTVTKPATETEKGQKTFTCVCGATKTEEIPEHGQPQPVDKSELQRRYNELENLPNHGYTQESWTIFTNALIHAKSVLADDNVTAEQVANALAALNNAANGLTQIAPPTPVIPVTPSKPAQLPFNPNAGSNVSKFPFADVPSDSWYYSSVKAAWENNLIDGVTANEFKPNATLTVAQTIKLAAALHQLDRTGEVSLKNGGANWYDSYVNYAVVNGIIEKDYANYTQAQMNAPVTRGEFVHIFHGAEEAYKAINTVADNAIPDVKTTDKFAAEIYELYRAGILTGSDAKGTFHSASTIKRSEAAAILLRMFEASARVSIDLP